MNQTNTGIVHGNTIVLDEPLAGMEGQAVEVTIRQAQAKAPWGEGIRASAGAWSAYPEMAEVMEQIHQERSLERRSSL